MTHVVIGGGIMGLLTSYYLHTAGENVVLVEQGKLGRESSWAGGGILSPLYPWRYPDALNELASWSQKIYPSLVEELREISGIDAQWIKSGMMFMDPEEIPRATEWASNHNVPLEIISGQQVADIAPNANSNTFDLQSIWMPDIAQVRNPRLLKALIAALQRNNVNLLEGTPVTDLIIENNRITGIKSNEQIIEASTVTVACGAWSSQVLKKWLPPMNVEPVRGQMILFKARPDTLHPIILKESHYLIPRKDGRIIAGSTLEFVGFDKRTTEDARRTLEEFAFDLVPELKNFPVEHHWSGLRPGNSVQIPFISQHPEISGLFVITGHYRNGVVTAPASATLCANLILSKPAILDTKAYSF